MKKSMKILALITLGLGLIITACNKDGSKSDKSDENDILKSASTSDGDIILKGDGEWEKVITKPLVKPDDCNYIVEGTIEYYLDGELVATVDYGDGECDEWATKTVDGETIEFSLKKEGEDDWFYEVITEPLVELEDCNYIVSGIIDYYAKKDDSWLATIDFGDGECDEWAIKTWDGGSKTFSLEEWGPK
jgi:hypothetical protein